MNDGTDITGDKGKRIMEKGGIKLPACDVEKIADHVYFLCTKYMTEEIAV